MPQALFIPVRWRRMSEFRGREIGRRNQERTAAVRPHMDSDVFLGWSWYIASTAKPFRLNSAHLTLLPDDTQSPNITPVFRTGTGNFKACRLSHKAPFPSLPGFSPEEPAQNSSDKKGMNQIKLGMSIFFFLSTVWFASPKKLYQRLQYQQKYDVNLIHTLAEIARHHGIFSDPDRRKRLLCHNFYVLVSIYAPHIPQFPMLFALESKIYRQK